MSMSVRNLSVLALVCLLGSGCAGLTPAAAIVNGDKVTEAQLQEEVDRVRDDPSFQELLRQQGDAVRGLARRQVLGRFIRESVIGQEAARRSIRATTPQINAFIDGLQAQVGGAERFKDLLEQSNLTRARVRVLAMRQVTQQELSKRVTADVTVPDERIRQWYEQNKTQFTQYKLAKIVVETQEQAQRIVDQVAAGSDFARLARERSKDPSAPRGGDLGFVDAQSLGGALASQVEAAPQGGVVGPVRGPEGFEVYNVAEKRATPLEQIRDRISAQLLSEEQQQAFEQWIGARLRAASIVVNPKYGRWDDASLAVVAASGLSDSG